MSKMRHTTLFVFFLLCRIRRGFCLCDDGQALLAFRASITSDPNGVLSSWKAVDETPCQWFGVGCFNDELISLNLSGSSLRVRIPLLGKLRVLQVLDLSNNHLTGAIPPDIGALINLRILNLGHNLLNGRLPPEIANLVDLQELHLNNNNFFGFILEDDTLFATYGTHLELKEHIAANAGLCNLKQLMVVDLSSNFLHGGIPTCLQKLPRVNLDNNCLQSPEWGVAKITQSQFGTKFPRRLQELPKKPNPPKPKSKGKDKKPKSKGKDKSHKQNVMVLGTLYALPGILVFLVAIFAAVVFYYKRNPAAVSPWKAGMSGNLHKAFCIEVPVFTLEELHSACEDFSNIIGSSPDSIIYKGTLKNLKEVAVTSIQVSSTSWSTSLEIFFRRKVEALARMKHEHLVNLVGYCASEVPFARMLVFEYAPNGTVFEHLHFEGSEHLDWNTRMRIVLGTAYGLEYMHHQLVPPASHMNFDSTAVFLTEDYAAKLAEFGLPKRIAMKTEKRKSFSNAICYDDLEGSDRLAPDFESNVFSFGVFLLEIISGRIPHDKDGSIVEWALEFMSSQGTIKYMVDLSLKAYDTKQLETICDIVRLCIQSDLSKRPTMKQILRILTTSLNVAEVITCPKNPALAWAELAILSPVD